MRQKKQYPVWDNYRYAFYHMRKKEGMGSIVLCVFDAVCGILLPFLEAALAGAMAACLVSGKRPQEILLMILGYVVILQGVRFCRAISGAAEQGVVHVPGKHDDGLFPENTGDGRAESGECDGTEKDEGGVPESVYRGQSGDRSLYEKFLGYGNQCRRAYCLWGDHRKDELSFVPSSCRSDASCSRVS